MNKIHMVPVNISSLFWQSTIDKDNLDMVFLLFTVCNMSVCLTRLQQRPITWQLWQQPKISTTRVWRRWVHLHVKDGAGTTPLVITFDNVGHGNRVYTVE